MPSQNIHIHDINAFSKCISVGSEMSGGVYNVLIENIKFGDSRPDNNWHAICHVFRNVYYPCVKSCLCCFRYLLYLKHRSKLS